MNKTTQALDEMIANILATLGSSKFWVTIGGMATSIYLAYSTGGKEAAIIAGAAAIGLPLTYVAAKTYQNTHGENAVPAAEAPKPIPSPSLEAPVLYNPTVDREYQPVEPEPPKVDVSKVGAYDYLFDDLAKWADEVYARVMTNPPTMPVIAYNKATANLTLRELKEYRRSAAIEDFRGQQETVFPYSDFEDTLRNKMCEDKDIHGAISSVWTDAKSHWWNFAVDMWDYNENK